jgi:hypothetical protein
MGDPFTPAIHLSFASVAPDGVHVQLALPDLSDPSAGARLRLSRQSVTREAALDLEPGPSGYLATADLPAMPGTGTWQVSVQVDGTWRSCPARLVVPAHGPAALLLGPAPRGPGLRPAPRGTSRTVRRQLTSAVDRVLAPLPAGRRDAVRSRLAGLGRRLLR